MLHVLELHNTMFLVGEGEVEVEVVVVVVVGVHSQFQCHQLDNLPASLTHKDSDAVEVVLYHFAMHLLCHH